MRTPPPSPPITRHTTSRAVLLSVWWGDTRLATELVPLSRTRRIRAVGEVSLPVELELAPDAATGDARLRCVGDGSAWQQVPRADDARELELGGLVVRATVTPREQLPAPARLDALTLGAFAASVLAHAGLALALLVSVRDPVATQRADLAALRALVARAAMPAHALTTPHATPAPHAAASTPDELPDPRTLDERRVPPTRAPLHVTPSPDQVARRGVLAATVFTPALRRAMARTRAAFARMARAPEPGASEPIDEQTYGRLGGAGTGAGGGCSSPEECATVATGPVHEDTGWGVRGAVAAAEPLQQRAIVAPALAAAAPPPRGELDMAYVRQLVRRELLADVQRCYADRLAQAALESGRVVVRFAVGSDGRVSGATIVSSAIRDVPTERCITRVIDAAAFPAVGASAEVTYPFVFSALAPDR